MLRCLRRPSRVDRFAPPVGDAPDAAITYRNDLRSFSLDADPDNALTEAAYAGTMLAAIAIGRAGVNLTRKGMRTVLDEGVFSVGLTATALSWTPDRHANRYLQAIPDRDGVRRLRRLASEVGLADGLLAAPAPKDLPASEHKRHLSWRS